MSIKAKKQGSKGRMNQGEWSAIAGDVSLPAPSADHHHNDSWIHPVEPVLGHKRKGVKGVKTVIR
jgi:hypothetical protein